MNAKRNGDIANLFQINPQGTVFDFRNSAASGVMPTRPLQLVGEHVLRPALFIAPSGDGPAYEIALLLHYLKPSMLSIVECPQS